VGEESSIYLQRAFKYPLPPYSPSKKYLEYPFEHVLEENQVYEGIRNIFRLWGLDLENYNMKKWNPLGEFISRGSKIFINTGGSFKASLSHPSFLRTILDYVFIATGGEAEVFIGFSPFDWEPENLPIIDFPYGSKFKIFFVNEGDPVGYTQINLGEASLFSSYNGNWKMFSAKGGVTTHNSEQAIYFLSTTALMSDLVIVIFKPSLNSYCGLGGAVASFLGFVEDPRDVPLYTSGKPSKGGDQCPEDSKNCEGEKGAWWRNDTFWRAVVDIVGGVLYFSYDGTFRSTPRPLLVLADMVEAMEEKPEIILAGTDPFGIDCVVAKIIGYNWFNLPFLSNLSLNKNFPLRLKDCPEFKLISEDIFLSGSLKDLKPLFFAREPEGWKGRLSLK